MDGGGEVETNVVNTSLDSKNDVLLLRNYCFYIICRASKKAVVENHGLKTENLGKLSFQTGM